MTAWVFTFGHGQRLRSTGSMGRAWDQHDIDSGVFPPPIGFALHDRYVRIAGEHEPAREVMVAIFGRVWSMEYAAGPETDRMIADYALRELDITESLEELATHSEYGPAAVTAKRLLDARAVEAPMMAYEVPYVNPGDDTANGSWAT